MIWGGTKNSSQGWAGVREGAHQLSSWRDRYYHAAVTGIQSDGAGKGPLQARKGQILMVSLGDSSCSHRGFPQCSQREEGACHLLMGGDSGDKRDTELTVVRGPTASGLSGLHSRLLRPCSAAFPLWLGTVLPTLQKHLASTSHRGPLEHWPEGVGLIGCRLPHGVLCLPVHTGWVRSRPEERFLGSQGVWKDQKPE